jgi:putative transposase
MSPQGQFVVSPDNKRGGTGARLHPGEQRILWEAIPKYLTFRGPSMKEIHQLIARRIRDANVDRKSADLPLLHTPSLTTVRKNIGKIGKLKVMIAREGEDMARKKFRPATTGVIAERPLERVEIDEHKLDLWAWITQAEWVDKLSDEERALLDPERSKARLWITLAIDRAIRVILAFVVTPSPDAEAAMQTLAQILSDKGH